MAHSHYDTFREEIARAYPAFGHALWEPDPGDYPPVEVGDVGFIREGQFHRLFNVLLPEDHESHERFGVPEGHVPLRPQVANHINRGVLTPNTFYSSGVTLVSGGFGVLATTTIGSADVSFSCTRKKGAVLSFPVTSRREDTLARDHFREWIVTHINSWFAFAQNLRLGIEMEDIVLVTGCHRTRTWSNISFNEVQTDARFSFGVEVAGVLGASINWRSSNLRIQVQGAVLSQGPSGEDLPENQCIFVRGFRIKRILFKTIPRIRGAAEPRPDPSGNDREPEKEAIPIPSVTEYRDALHVLLEYIASQAPNCDMALVHDDDLEQILQICDGSLETLKPALLMDCLQRSKLEIGVLSKESLPMDDEARLYTDHMVVGMLSEQLKSLDPLSSALSLSVGKTTKRQDTDQHDAPRYLSPQAAFFEPSRNALHPDSVVDLNNILQRRPSLTPLLRFKSKKMGPNNNPTHEGTYTFRDIVVGEGMGRTIGLAKQAAAERALQYFHTHGIPE